MRRSRHQLGFRWRLAAVTVAIAAFGAWASAPALAAGDVLGSATEHPAVSPGAAVTDAAAPVLEANAPVIQAAAPVTEATKPATDAAVEATKPVLDATTPVVEHAPTAVNEKTAPLVETVTATAETVTPMVAPVLETVQPLTNESERTLARKASVVAPALGTTRTSLETADPVSTRALAAAAQRPSVESSGPSDVTVEAAPIVPAAFAVSRADDAVTTRTDAVTSGRIGPAEGVTPLPVLPELPLIDLTVSSADDGQKRVSAAPLRIPLPDTPAGPLSAAISAISAAGSGGASLTLLAALAATFLLAAPGLGRRLRPRLAPWPQPILQVSLERPG